VAKFVKEGKDVALVVVTNGDKGSSDRTMTSARLAAIRAEEQRSASRTLGVEQSRSSAIPTARSRTRASLRLEVAREIRRHRPDLLICQNPCAPTSSAPRTATTASSAASRWTACIRSRAITSRSRAAAGVRAPQGARGLRHAVAEPHVVVDISDVMDLKIKGARLPREPVQGLVMLEKRVRERGPSWARRPLRVRETFDRIVMG